MESVMFLSPRWRLCAIIAPLVAAPSAGFAAGAPNVPAPSVSQPVVHLAGRPNPIHVIPENLAVKRLPPHHHHHDHDADGVAAGSTIVGPMVVPGIGPETPSATASEEQATTYFEKTDPVSCGGPRIIELSPVHDDGKPAPRVLYGARPPCGGRPASVYVRKAE